MHLYGHAQGVDAVYLIDQSGVYQPLYGKFVLLGSGSCSSKL